MCIYIYGLMHILAYLYFSLSLYLYVCLYIYIYTYVRTYVRTYIHTYIHTYTYIYYIYIYMNAFIRLCSIVQAAGHVLIKFSMNADPQAPPPPPVSMTSGLRDSVGRSRLRFKFRV